MLSFNFTWRVKIILLVNICVAIILIIRLYDIQIVNHQRYTQKAENQYSSDFGASFNRGSIFFKTKDGELVGAATIKDGYTIALNPKILSTIENDHTMAINSKVLSAIDDSYNRLNQITAIDKESFFSKALKKEDPYEEIKKRVSKDEGLAVNKAEIPGVRAYKEYWRYYPAEKSASHVLGFVGYDKDNNFLGRYGLEKFYESVLSRKEDRSYNNFFVEILSLVKTDDKKESQEGDLVTFIEPTVQNFLRSETLKIKDVWESNTVGGIIMDPKTGEILAMSSLPEFDPNYYNLEKNSSVFTNVMVEGVYEPGSIMKPITMSIGIDSGSISPESYYVDEGKLTLNGKTIYNVNKVGKGRVSMQTVLDSSLNTGAAYVALKVGRDDFKKYIKNFGLGELTGIDLPGEVTGKINNLDSPREIELATISYGQGISVSPIAMTRALSALANGGVLVNPHIVSEIKLKGNDKKIIEVGNQKRVISEETSKKVTEMLVHVFDYALKGGAFKMDDWSVAAKTGTALLTKPTGGYYQDRFLHSFFGYFPANKPRFIVFLFQIDPKGAEFASDTLTEPFMNITNFLINYYNIPPDR